MPRRPRRVFRVPTPTRTSPETVCTRMSPSSTALRSTSPDVVEIADAAAAIEPIVTSPETARAVSRCIDALDPDVAGDGHDRTRPPTTPTNTSPLAVFTWSRPTTRRQTDVARRGARRDLAELAVDADVRRGAREVEVGARRAGDAALEIAAPRDLDRPPAEAVALLDPDDVPTRALVHA